MKSFAHRAFLALALTAACALAACDGSDEPDPAGGENRAPGSASTIGLYKPGETKFYLRKSNSAGDADAVFAFGPPGQKLLPVAGDWEGDSKVSVGLYNPATGIWFLRNSNSSGAADITFAFGPGDARPIAGPWA